MEEDIIVGDLIWGSPVREGSDGLIVDIIFEGGSWYGGTGMSDFDGI